MSLNILNNVSIIYRISINICDKMVVFDFHTCEIIIAHIPQYEIVVIIEIYLSSPTQ